MYKVRIRFRFTFDEETQSIMGTSHVGCSEFSRENAIIKAWVNMADDEFTRNLILNTKKIEVIRIEDIP